LEDVGLKGVVTVAGADYKDVGVGGRQSQIYYFSMGQIQLYFGEVAEFWLENRLIFLSLLILYSYEFAVDLLDLFLRFHFFPIFALILLLAFPILLLLFFPALNAADMHNRLTLFPEHHHILVAGEAIHQVKLFFGQLILVADSLLSVVVQAVLLHQ